MPSREFSRMILGASWPHADPSDWQSAADAQRAKGAELVEVSEQLKEQARRVGADQSGRAIDGYVARLLREAVTKSEEADKRFAMSRAAKEISQVYYGLREDLDQLDRHAHEKINEIRSSSSTFASQLAMWQAIEDAVSSAALSAKTKDTAAALAITRHGTQIGIGAELASDAQGGSGLDLDPSQINGFGGLGGRAGLGGMPQAPPGLAPVPDRPGPLPDDGIKGHRGDGLLTDRGNDGDGIQTDGDSGKNADRSKNSPSPRDSRGGDLLPDQDSEPSMPTTLGGAGSSPLSSAGGGLSGLKIAGTSSLSGAGAVPPGLSAGYGLSTPSAGNVPSPAIPPTAASADFSRGLGAGLNGAPPLLAPPANPVPPSTSSAPAGVIPTGPASTPAAAGPPVSSPGSALSPAPLSGGGVSVGSGSPMGPLPPFGSDVRSAPAGVGGAVAPAGTGSLPATADRAGSGAAPPLALPPGVVSSGVGAGAGVSATAAHSSFPDPLLESASELVYQLVHASRVYGIFLDWCVGMFRTRSGVRTVIVSSEGAGCIPRGVFVPRETCMLFSDPGLSLEFRARWFSWANPAETMLAYSNWAGDNADLRALAVSTANGGSSIPALEAGIPHIADCAQHSSPISADADPMSLDGEHQHRLETIDPPLYARMTGTAGRRPDKSEAWRMTSEAADAALSRAGSLPDLAAPFAIREALDLIRRGHRVSSEQWEALRAAGFDIAGMSAGLRPGRMRDNDAASAYVLAYHDLARLVELLLLWDLDNDADGPAMKYPEIAYLAMQIAGTPRLVSDAST